MLFRCLLGMLIFCAAIDGAWADDRPFYARFFDHLDRKIWFPSDGWVNGDHQSCEWRADALRAKNARLLITLSNRGGKLRPFGCGEVQTQARFGYGQFSARLRTAAGSGLNTAFFTYIGPPMGVPEHDEIDFEFLGKDPRTVEVTYWTAGKKGNPKIVQLGFDASKEYHNYMIDWRPDGIRWYVDDVLVYKTEVGTPIPRNRAKIFLSLWSGSPEWMGQFTYKHPVTADVVWVKYTPLKDLEVQPPDDKP